MKHLIYNFGLCYEVRVPHDKTQQPYVISNSKWAKGRTMTFQSDKRGYLVTRFWIDGRHVTRRLHQLVAEAVYGLRPEGLTVNHMDGNKLNNRPENLEYITSAENVAHAHKLGLYHHPSGDSWVPRVFPTGKNHHNYKHGRTGTIEYNRERLREWRKKRQRQEMDI